MSKMTKYMSKNSETSFFQNQKNNVKRRGGGGLGYRGVGEGLGDRGGGGGHRGRGIAHYLPTIPEKCNCEN